MMKPKNSFFQRKIPIVFFVAVILLFTFLHFFYCSSETNNPTLADDNNDSKAVTPSLVVDAESEIVEEEISPPLVCQNEVHPLPRILGPGPQPYHARAATFDELITYAERQMQANTPLNLPQWKRLFPLQHFEGLTLVHNDYSHLKTAPAEQALVRIFKWGAEQCTGRYAEMVDVGVNGGYFPAMLASLNCAVVGFDPSPACLRKTELNLALNAPDRAPLVTLVGRPVSFVPFKFRYNKELAGAGCDPGTSLNGQDPNWGIKSGDFANENEMLIQSVSIVDVIPENQPIIVMKIDVEGAEASVLKSTMPLLKNRAIQVLVFEWLQKTQKVLGISSEESKQILTELASCDYILFELPHSRQILDFDSLLQRSGMFLLVRDEKIASELGFI